MAKRIVKEIKGNIKLVEIKAKCFNCGRIDWYIYKDCKPDVNYIARLWCNYCGFKIKDSNILAIRKKSNLTKDEIKELYNLKIVY